MKTLRASKNAVQERLAAHASRLDVKLSEAKMSLIDVGSSFLANNLIWAAPKYTVLVVFRLLRTPLKKFYMKLDRLLSMH
jgi:hypothetical protein